MPHYKDAENKLHFLENDLLAYILPEGCAKITDAEADAIRDTDKAAAAADAAIPAATKAKNNISTIETAQTPRRIREALLEIADKVGADCTFLRNLDANIAAERVKIK